MSRTILGIWAFCVLPAASAGKGSLPCDVLDAAGNPCVAAHSMVRALYSAYSGPLYQVERSSDNKTADVPTTSAGGLADVRVQESLCAKVQCVVSKIYDQSPKGNHLFRGPGGEAVPMPDAGVRADGFRVEVDGQMLYGAYFEGGQGYRTNNAIGTATGDEPETMYMVVDSRHFNDKCCFDYGNAETDALDHGPGTMEALYFGGHEGLPDPGPHIQGDLEDGLWPGQFKTNPKNKGINATYVMAMLKGEANRWALKFSDAQQSDGLKSIFEGPRPENYTVMKKQGAIILGTGGDNSNWDVGTWYEGAVATGYTSDATDVAVQVAIASARYGQSSTSLVV